MNTPVIIFSLARSGSTSLANIFNSLKPGSCLIEPFNPDVVESIFYRPIAETRGVCAALEELWKAYPSIKHVWSPKGWPFAPGSQHNLELLLAGNARIVVLYRKNNLKRIVSGQLAAQSKIWHACTEEQVKRRLSIQYKPIDPRVVSHLLVRDTQALSAAKESLVTSKKDWIDLPFEDLFDPAIPPLKRVQKLKKVLQFSHIQTPQNSDALLESLLSQSPEQSLSFVYRLVPGLERINRLFGSQQSGFLF